MERTNDLSREIPYKMGTLGCLALQKMIFELCLMVFLGRLGGVLGEICELLGPSNERLGGVLGALGKFLAIKNMSWKRYRIHCFSLSYFKAPWMSILTGF